MGTFPYALQLYTVRDHMEKDVAETLRQVKAVGYDYVEIAGTCGLAPEAFHNLLRETGLEPVAAHQGYKEVVEHPDLAAETAGVLGIAYVVIPYLGGDLARRREEWLRCAEQMDRAGASLRESGIQLCYHNHAHEFEAVDGERPFDIIFNNTDPANLAAELDAYWVQYAGEDPLAMVRAFRGRCPLLHVKDMTAEAPHTFAEVGRGIIEWCPILEAAREGGTEWFIVEQDVCEGDSMASAEISARYMDAL